MRSLHLFVLTGFVQGLTIWWLNYSEGANLWPVDTVVRTSILFFISALPLVLYLTEKIPELSKKVRSFSIAFYGIFYAALGAYLKWAAGTNQIHFAILIATTILGFVSLQLLIGFNFTQRRWQYASLFNYSWRNGTLLFASFLITGVFWIVLMAGSELMSLINLNWIKEVIAKPIFIYPVTCMVVAGSIFLGLIYSSIAQSSRHFALLVSSWLLILLLSFGVVWVAALPFEGLTTLFNTRQAAFLLCWFVALSVAFSSCVYQDGQDREGKSGGPYVHWLNQATQLAWLSLLPIAAIACWALFLRIQQYGWTPSRIWAALVAELAIIYVIGYSLSWFDRHRWMSTIGRTNIVAAVILCLTLIALLTPIADINRLSVASQMERIRHAALHSTTVEPDWTFLGMKSGRFGRDELEKIATGNDMPDLSLKVKNNWRTQATNTLALSMQDKIDFKATTAQERLHRLKIYPKGQTLPPGFLAYIQSPTVDMHLQSCLSSRPTCNLWVGDLRGNGQIDIVFFDAFFPNKQGILFSMVDNKWKPIGYLSGHDNIKLTDEQFQNAQTRPANWFDLMIGGVRYQIVLD